MEKAKNAFERAMSFVSVCLLTRESQPFCASASMLVTKWHNFLTKANLQSTVRKNATVKLARRRFVVIMAREIVDDLDKLLSVLLPRVQTALEQCKDLSELLEVVILADEFGKRVIVVNTSNEIAGDGDVPHFGIGLARRMQVPSPGKQADVMIEAIENHVLQEGRPVELTPVGHHLCKLIAFGSLYFRLLSVFRGALKCVVFSSPLKVLKVAGKQLSPMLSLNF